MTTRWKPTAEDHSEALRRVLSGLVRGDDMHELSKDVADLHPRDNTFPGEVFMRLALDALEAAGVDQDNPLRYEGLRDDYLPECQFRGRENGKIRFAVLALGSTRAASSPISSMRSCGGRPTTSGGSPWRLLSPSFVAAQTASVSRFLLSANVLPRDRAPFCEHSLVRGTERIFGALPESRVSARRSG